MRRNSFSHSSAWCRKGECCSFGRVGCATKCFPATDAASALASPSTSPEQLPPEPRQPAEPCKVDCDLEPEIDRGRPDEADEADRHRSRKAAGYHRIIMPVAPYRRGPAQPTNEKE